MDILLNRWNRIVRVGESITDTRDQAIAVRLSNLCTLAGISTLSLIVPVLWLGGSSNLIGHLVIAAGLLALVPLCNHLSLSAYGRFLLIVVSNYILMALACGLGPEAGIHSGFYLTFMLPIVFFSPKETKGLYFSSTVTPIFMLVTFSSQFSFFERGQFSPMFVQGFGILGNLFLMGLASCILYRLFTLYRKHLDQAELNGYQQNRLISLVSQDVDANIKIIQSSLKLMERYQHITNEAAGKRYYERAMRAFDALDTIIDNVRAHTQLGSYQAEVKLEPVDFKQCQDYINFTFEDQLIAKGVHLEFKDLCSPHTRLLVDPLTFIHSILTNIISNAIKYSHPGGTVKVSLEHEGNMLKLQVQDQGVGMATEEQTILFDHVSRDSKEGTIGETSSSGIGMHIVKKNVDILGGKIQVESEENQGTTVTLLIAEAPELAQEETHAPPKAS
jgi:signal transduction histidine kinase